ncbi:hypothetical protein HYFRA_00005122, partial [Hymenoscyphus fraxineus]
LAVQDIQSRPLRGNPSFPAYTERPQTPPKLARFPGIQSPEILEKRLADFVHKLHSYQQSWEGSGKRQCPGPRDHQGLEDQDSMSRRPSASRPASRSPSDGQRIVLPAVQTRDDPRDMGGHGERHRLLSDSRAFQLQPSSERVRPNLPAPVADEWRSSGPSRDLGVHSILNPSGPESSRQTNRRSTIAESPQSVGSISQLGPSASTTTTPTTSFPNLQTSVSTPPAGESYNAPYAHQRRILTPRSPSRAISSGRGRAMTTIDAQISPFLPPRSARTEGNPPLESPPVPNPATQYQQHYGFPSTSAPAVDRRTSMPASGQAPLSQSASPSISVSSQNPSSAQTSPASFLYHKGGQGVQAPAAPTSSSSSYFPGSFAPSMQNTSGGGMQGLQYQGSQEGPYSAPDPQTPGGGSSLNSTNAGSSRQTSASDPIQVLTITTSSGQYQVPVDVHQASRLADEKRARNAGASARFRQRRKEKEREASTSIETLQKETRELERRLHEVEQERDFYRSERDRFRDAVFRSSDLRHLAMQGPPSPNSMRGNSSFSTPRQNPGATSGFGAQPPPSLAERAPRRRRIDGHGEFASMPYTTGHPLAPASLPPVNAPSHAPGPQGPQSLPPLRMEAPATTQAAASTQPAATSGPQSTFEPYPRPPGPFDRPWQPDNSRR